MSWAVPPPTTASPGVPTLALGSCLVLGGSLPANASPMSHPKAAVPAPKVESQCPAEVPVPPCPSQRDAIAARPASPRLSWLLTHGTPETRLGINGSPG